MTLNNIKLSRKDRGFTIVELLIVIIVIAILAAIVIATYTGITQRANTSSAQGNANQVIKKAEAFAADTNGGNGNYPGCVSSVTTGGPLCPTPFKTATGLGQLPSGVSLVATALGTTPTQNIQYVACTGTAATAATGYYVGYFDYTQGKEVYAVGGTNVTAGANNTTAPTCSNPSSS